MPTTTRELTAVLAVVLGCLGLAAATAAVARILTQTLLDSYGARA